MLKPELNLTDSSIYRVPTADPIHLIRLLSTALPHFFERFRGIRPDCTFLSCFIQDLASIRLTWMDITALVGLILMIHFIRAFVTGAAKSWVARNHIFPRYVDKFPESVWKVTYYGSSWIFSLFVHTCIPEVKSFNDPLSMWEGWSEGIPPPIHPAILLVYASQTAFYIHSIYATLYLDIWRKDSWLMFIHHFVTITMLLLSYVDNFTLCGGLLLLLHDSSDALLDLAKLGMYLRRRKNGDYYKIIDIAGSTIFLIFVANWILCRLYWYACKLLYGTLYGAIYFGPQDATFFPVLGVMLVMIYALNIYWFNFIARMLWRVITTGEEPEDNREWDTTAVSGLSQSSLDAIAEKKKR
ncbi:unnamed protein product [Cylicocyclus nassatus]|uniref:TLC domain-containing protein n=1 Tax=Cylicocyclus nassatus TaxID=53992 RepID=A0AA36GNN8_CYLNA|nr:unnamed protein product [Cylicocyclus nassatus]